ncbi:MULTISPECIES: MlaC/ttg2D family ABC transporter substrate-binding protein [Rhodanobacteraceae]|uniref:MlaC/ttg2D family ABC transporter substrate-binding protein n=1 Tax=Rhodanobacteraceae TaxID=1775411 RepID=UPI000567D6EF|nr:MULTISPECIES: ABC transporter substrate-binding protein [Rhodanobacteraceae]MDR6643640.1 phospholipid transport system substrate-binding protein [Luteibacter sp. 1214]SDG62340.1 phospholipid transport system substrate-binding protein [Dyella sp. 333MFSha]SKB36388.1 phospholipid transport system substrate-binding protein [Luteibacter sp. 22Crub2.1]
MLRQISLAIALAIGTVVAAPVLAQDAAPASAGQQQGPQQVVQTISDDLAKAIEGHQAELKNDKEKLIAVIDDTFLPHFDIDYASILVLGQHAKEASPQQRERFAKAFYNSITHRYAEGLLNYTRGRVKVLPFNGDLNKSRTLVQTQVVLDDGKTVSVNYVFRQSKTTGDWKAYDVVIEGISYITNYRNQVDAEIKKEGLDKLTADLEQKGAGAIEEMKQDTGGANK